MGGIIGASHCTIRNQWVSVGVLAPVPDWPRFWSLGAKYWGPKVWLFLFSSSGPRAGGPALVHGSRCSFKME